MRFFVQIKPRKRVAWWPTANNGWATVDPRPDCAGCWQAEPDERLAVTIDLSTLEGHFDRLLRVFADASASLLEEFGEKFTFRAFILPDKGPKRPARASRMPQDKRKASPPARNTSRAPRGPYRRRGRP